MDKDNFRELLQKYAEGRALSPEEETQLRQGYDQLLESALHATPADPADEQGRDLRRRIENEIAGRQTKRFRLRDFHRIAAALLIGMILLAGTYWLWPGPPQRYPRGDHGRQQ
ncbi:hypothetical protein WJU16_04590 [Chitinophaga pollutisoli]|uniref:DUF1700 domain-containing protein n=1 Tax=Chitinophaga pollutisoli TaxID=3133966 RepID=A0ABZ2YR89_9BACT